ncbi:restriction endonuclease subunit S [Alkalihalophilus marmarensis]|uniref:restriction endonuclease subunit S n=1 Tax=Alkalihalophilus marmarensis TaxID=521377 RepID=UPI002DB5D615|nr:restriction endonuclease subunit S [Alkalihalophilus marmarensis]MEC2072483.1 restriction endonuclease subunit S [Alkalihalophilus marmarensis]
MVSDWSKVKLENVSEIIGGGTPSKAEPSYWDGAIPWATPTDLTSGKKRMLTKTKNNITEAGLGKSSAKLLPAGSVLMTSRATIGECAINQVPMATNQGFANFICRKGTHNKYLFYLLSYLKPDFEKLGSGSTFKEISKKTLKSYLVNFAPYEEQLKIASILTSVDTAIEKTEAIIEQAEKVKKGLMQQLLTKGIGHTKFKKTEIGEIPEEWEVKSLSDLANENDKYSFVGGPFGSDLKSEDYTEKGVRIIQLQNIKDGYFSNEYKIYTSAEKADQLQKCNIYPGDLIIAKMAEPLARACVVPDIEERFVMASDGIRLSIDESQNEKHFLMYAINSPYFRQQAINNSTGTTRQRIGLKTLRNLKVAVPPFLEQKKITNLLVSVESKLNNDLNRRDKLNTLKKSLMQVLLTGKVRVKVDE